MPVDESAELQQLIMMSGQAPDDQVEDVLLRLSEAGSYGRVAPGRDSIVISAFGDPQMIRSLSLEDIPGVERVLPVSKPYKLVSAEASPDPTIIQVRGRRIGGKHFGLIAGPCTVESREQTLETARAVNAAGATMLRGGAFKPRTSPYSFQGLGSEALAILAEAREDTGLPLVTEVLDPRQLEEVVETADVLQIGARNMQNFLLLAEVGKTDQPVIVDPSHPAGRRELVPALARAAVAAGADGIIVEAHPAPEEALCDAPHLIPTSRFAAFAEEINQIVEVMGKEIG